MLSIIIVNYNTFKSTVDCIDSILSSNLKDIIYEIIIIENNFTNNKYKFTQKNIKVVSMNDNKGYSKALNFGISISSYDYILAINPDVIVFENSILDIFNYYIRNNHIGIIGPKVINTNCTFQISSRRRFPYFRYLLPYFFKLHKLGFNNYYNYEEQSNDEILKVDSISGCFTLFSKYIYEKVGIFDERFFLYFEDTDYCIRSTILGYDVVYYPTSVIKHKKYNSRNLKNYLFVKFHFYKSFFKFFIKYSNYYLKF